MATAAGRDADLDADTSLAHQLLTADARQRSLITEGLDSVIGPAATEDFVRRYQREVGNVFRPRTLVVDGTDRRRLTREELLKLTAGTDAEFNSRTVRLHVPSTRHPRAGGCLRATVVYIS